MINTVIIDDNIEYIKYLMNSVISKLEDIRVTHILTNGKDALDIIEKNNVDLILLDLKMPNISGKIKKMNLIKYPKIIVISGEIDYIYCIKNQVIISNIIEKNSSIETIQSKLESTVNSIGFFEREEHIKKKIIDELSNLGYNFKYKGTYYIFDTILYVYASNDFELLDNLEKNVYKYVANKYNKSINNIKTNIIKSTKLITNNKYIEENLTPKIVVNNILIKLISDKK